MIGCRPSWPDWSCSLGHLCGYFSDVGWLVVLLPQICKNYTRQSTDGLSLLWALLNITAGIINMFYVLESNTPLLARVVGCYYPVLEALLLLQFALYFHNSKYLSEKEWHKRKFIIFFIVWVVLLAIEIVILCGNEPHAWNRKAMSSLQLLATSLWCVELLPQIYINFRERSVFGQSSYTVVLLSLIKTAEFGSAFLLQDSLQSAILAYFSSSISYINIMQVAFYNTLPASTATVKIVLESESTMFSPKMQVYGARLVYCLYTALLLLMSLALMWRGDFHVIFILCPFIFCCVIYAIFSLAVSHQAKLRATAVLQHFLSRNSNTYAPLMVVEEIK